MSWHLWGVCVCVRTCAYRCVCNTVYRLYTVYMCVHVCRHLVLKPAAMREAYIINSEYFAILEWEVSRVVTTLVQRSKGCGFNTCRSPRVHSAFHSLVTKWVAVVNSFLQTHFWALCCYSYSSYTMNGLIVCWHHNLNPEQSPIKLLDAAYPQYLNGNQSHNAK